MHKFDRSFRNRNVGNLRWLWLTWIVFLLDQGTKWMAIRHLYYLEPVRATSFLNWRLSYNNGASFGFLNHPGEWQRWLFGLIAAFASYIIYSWMSKLPRNAHGQAAALAFILGGALGNLWDRLFHGYVIDFIDFHVNTWHFATFNIADSAVTCGAVLLALAFLAKPNQAANPIA